MYACFARNVLNTPVSTAVATAYDAFGKVRNGDYSDRPGGALNLLPDTLHGFTGHQHVDDVRLIHMNGRVYDYQLGRFLSVDPVIQFPTNTQSMNPYSYIMNNPLSGRDPTGYQVDSDDMIGHGITTGVKVTFDLETVKAQAKENHDSYVQHQSGSQGPSTKVVIASAAAATAPTSQQGVNNTGAPTEPTKKDKANQFLDDEKKQASQLTPDKFSDRHGPNEDAGNKYVGASGLTRREVNWHTFKKDNAQEFRRTHGNPCATGVIINCSTVAVPTIQGYTYMDSAHTHFDNNTYFSGTDWNAAINMESEHRFYLLSQDGKMSFTTRDHAETYDRGNGLRHIPPSNFPGIPVKGVEIDTEYHP